MSLPEFAQDGLWGVPPALYVGAFAAAGAAAWALSNVVGFRLRRGRPAVRELHAYEVAYLSGGIRHAIATVVAALRADDAISVGATGRIISMAETPATAGTPLDLLVHGQIRRGMATTLADLTKDPRIREEIEALRDGLAREGLALGEDERRAMSRAGRPLGLLALLAFGALFSWVLLADEGARTGDAIGAGIATIFITIILNVFRLSGRGETTRTGKAAVKDTAARYAYLDPRAAPAWRTYGPPGVALGVALFGTAALMSIAPQFTAAVGLGRYLAMSGGSASSGISGSSGGSGFSCSSSASVCSSGAGGGGSACGSGGSGGGCGGGGGGGCGGGGGGGGGCGGGGG